MMRPVGLLLLATLLWGFGNVAQKTALESIGPFAVVAIRCGLGALVLLPLLHPERGRGCFLRDLVLEPWHLTVSLSFAAALILQQIAAGLTTATNMGFLINLCIVLTPLLTWMLDRERPQTRLVIAAFIACSGAAMMSGFGIGPRFGLGDLLSSASALVYAVWIVAVERAVKSAAAPVSLTVLQLIVTCVLSGVIAMAFEPFTLESARSAVPDLIFLGIFSTGAAFVFSAKAQARLPANTAAIIMSLEAVFSALGGWLILDEQLTPLALVGALLLLGGITLVQVKSDPPRREAPPEPEPAADQPLASPFSDSAATGTAGAP